MKNFIYFANLFIFIFCTKCEKQNNVFIFSDGISHSVYSKIEKRSNAIHYKFFADSSLINIERDFTFLLEKNFIDIKYDSSFYFSSAKIGDSIKLNPKISIISKKNDKFLEYYYLPKELFFEHKNIGFGVNKFYFDFFKCKIISKEFNFIESLNDTVYIFKFRNLDSLWSNTSHSKIIPFVNIYWSNKNNFIGSGIYTSKYNHRGKFDKTIHWKVIREDYIEYLFD